MVRRERARRSLENPGSWFERDVTRRVFLGGLAAAAALPVGCGAPESEEYALTTSTMPGSQVKFPPPTTSAVVLETALERRRSVRDFTVDALTEAEIGQLLWAAQGITGEPVGRTAPSAGALYPLELFALTSERSLRYVPDGHRGEVLTERDLRPALMAAARGQEAVGSAPLVVVLVGVPERTAVKYGDRAPRYVDLEAGHAAQNLLLQAVALDLGGVPIGSFDDDQLTGVLALPGGHEPRYIVPIGHAR